MKVLIVAHPDDECVWFAPWVDHSERYERLGWQRRWGRYQTDNMRLWNWWAPDAPVKEEVTA